MNVQQQFSQILESLAKLGARRLAALGVIGVLAVGAFLLAAGYFARPAMDTLYAGLNAQDIGRISGALADAGIQFDVNEQRTAVLVPLADKARARVHLAKMGLPANATAGYELFDQMGSLGLTSFMQEVTRLRALEGEIARTIQALDGVDAARVHLVLPEQGSFRRASREPSASVVVRTGPEFQQETTSAIRNIVSAAVAGLKIEQVSVASSSGQVLASGGDARTMASHKLSSLEDELAKELEERAGRTLAPVLGIGNYQISLSVRLDIDQQRIAETIFDPKSRIERSVRVVKQSNVSENSQGKPTVGVQANIPEQAPESAASDSSRQKDDKREETTNYELNTKRVETERQGYRVQKIAIAAVINRDRVMQGLGAGADQAALDARMDELKRLISAATGFDTERGDQIEVSAIPFDAAGALAPLSGPGPVDYLAMNAGTIVSALALVIIAALVIWFAIRPALTVLARDRSENAVAQAEGGAGIEAVGGFAGGDFPVALEGGFASPLSDGEAGFGSGFGSGFGGYDQEASPRDRLQQLVEANEQRVTRVLKQWLHEQRGAA